MLLSRVGQFLGLQLLQGADDAETCITRFDYIVDIAILRSVVRVGKQLGIFCFLFSHEGFRIGSFLGFLGIEYLNCTGTTHYGNFGCRPCIVHIATQLLAAHHNVRTSIRLAQGNSHLRHSSLSVSVQQFCTMQDNGIVFLSCSRQESRHIYQRNDRNVEGIAETDKTCPLREALQ